MLVILAIIFMKFSICFCASVDGKIQSLEKNVCSTPACLSAAKSIAQNMNTLKKPCDNFYLFACGKFVKGADVPRGQPYTNPLMIIENEVQEMLKRDLEQNFEVSEPRTFQLLKSYYDACVNSAVDTEEVEKEYESAIQLKLEDLGGWPVTKGQSWDESTFDWLEFIGNVHQSGLTKTIHSFIHLSEVGKKNPKDYKIDRPLTGIDRSYLLHGLENKEVRAYYDSMVNLSKHYGAEELKAKEELEKSLQFEIQLAKIPQLSGGSSYTVEQLENETFPWYDYLNQFLPDEVDIDPKRRVYVNLKSFYSLVDLIDNTDKRIVANYALWRVVQELNDVMNDRATFTKNNFVAQKTEHYLWKHCVQYLMENMPVAMGALYVKKHFNKSSKNDVQEITANLMRNYKRFVSETKSMNNLTKGAAQKKLDSMQIRVAYPDELVNDEKLDGYFQSLYEPIGNFFQNHLDLMAFNYHDLIRRKTHNFYEHDWVYQASVANPAPRNNYKRNSIIINAAILQKEFFDANVPNYLNYAGIGRVIGHEITHAFDNHGSKFDERGNRVDWWDRKAWKEFQNDTQCLAEQYRKYKASKRAMALNGTTTLHENIADHGGIKVAYAAYEEWIKQNGEEPGLAGLPYTPRQLFWLNLAHTECSRIRKEGWDELVEGDHSPGPFRILGTLPNMLEFARDFNCPAGSRMNPPKKCSFWWNR